MIVSRNSRWAAVAATVVLTASLAAAAQTGKPRQLIPSGNLAPGATGVETEPLEPPGAAPSAPPASAAEQPPAAAQGPAPAAEPRPPETAPTDEVVVGTLDTVDPSAVGLLDPESGGFGLEMWAGSSRALVERLLPRLPVGTSSPIMQSLARRLLLSTARVPEGKAAAPTLLGVRVERLAAAGEIGAVVELLRFAPQRLEDAALARAEIDAKWLGGDNAGACARARDMVRRDEDSYWLKSLTFCRALNGEHAAAGIAVGLLREQGEDDPPFFTLMAALAGDPEAKVESLSQATPLHLAMVRAARQTIPADALDGAGPAVLRVIAGSPNASLELRLAAAERAAAAGVVPVERLAQIYSGISFTPEDMANALSIAETDPGPRTAALLFQVAQIQEVPTARAEALQAAWRLARKSDRYFLAAKVNLSATVRLEPSPELAFAAADVGRALLAAGRIEAVIPWYEMVRQKAMTQDPEATQAALDLWALLQIGDPDATVPWDPGFVGLWWQGQADLPKERRAERAELLYTLLTALGYEVPAVNWEPLFDALTVTGTMPSPALRNGLARAAREGRLGETVLLSLLALGPGGPAGANIETVAAAVEALRTVGLRVEARAVALEAALMRGL